MTYALIENDAVAQYPYSFTQLRRDNPQVSFPRDEDPATLELYGCFTVAPMPPPSPALEQNVVEVTPTLIGDVWTQTWALVAASPEEIAERETAATLAADTQAAREDAFVQSFLAMTPAEVEAYVETHTNNIAEVRALLRKIAMMLHIVTRETFAP